MQLKFFPPLYMKLIVIIFLLIGKVQGGDEFDDPVAVMKCVNGSVRIRTPEESASFFKPIIQDCRNIPNGKIYEHAYWDCMLSRMGMAQDFKRPTMDTMGDFYCRMFSPEILEEVPSYKRKLRSCADYFVRSFNRRAGDDKHYLIARLLNCSVAEMFAQLGDAILHACTPSLLEIAVRKTGRATLLYCENMALEGGERLEQFLNMSMDANCTVAESYNKAVVDLGVIAKDGTPTLRKVRKLLDLMYPSEVLENTMIASELIQCGNNFVRLYTQGDVLASQAFVECFWKQHAKFQPDMDIACHKLEKIKS